MTPPRRRRATAGVIVAALLVLPGCGRLGDDSAAETPEVSAAPSPSAEVTTGSVPFIAGGVLHADGHEVPTESVNLLAAGDTVLVGESIGDAEWTWDRVRDGRREPLPMVDGTVPVLSNDGRTVAVTRNPTPETTRVLTYDVATGAEQQRLDLALPFTCCAGALLCVVGIDDAGRVFWSVPDGPQLWTPGGDVVDIAGPGIAVTDAGHDTVLLSRGDGSAALGTVDRSGAFTVIEEDLIDGPMVWDMRDRRPAWVERERAMFYDRDGGSTTQLPVGRVQQVGGWDGDRLVLLRRADDGTQEIVRCTLEGECTRLADAPARSEEFVVFSN